MLMIKQRQRIADSCPPATSSVLVNSTSCSEVPQASERPEIILGLITASGGQDFPHRG